MRNPERTFLALALALLLGACQEPAVPPEGATLLADTPGSSPALVFAVHPYDTPSRLVSRFQPLCDYLGARLKRPVQLYLAQSYGDEIRRITHGQVDLAYLGPTPYLRAHDHYLEGSGADNIQILAGETQGGEIGYRGVIVALASGPIGSVADLRGRTLALGDPRSFSGHFVPRAQLASARMSLADLRDYAYLGRHERVALAVVHGDFEAGALREDVARLYLDRGLRVVARSALLPPHVVVARPGLDPALAAAVRAALVDAGPDAAAALAALGSEVGFAAVDDARYDPVRVTVRAIEGKHREDPPLW